MSQPGRERNPHLRRDAVRTVAFRAITEVTGNGAYANIVGGQLIHQAGLEGRDAALATELINGTCRGLGTYERIIEVAARRGTDTLEADVVDLLCLGAHQLLATRIPAHAAISTSVDLARQQIGARVTGLVNAVLRKVAQRSLEQWLDDLARDQDPIGAVAVRTMHPEWIVTAFADRLGLAPDDPQLQQALDANNVAAEPTLVARPGLISVDELVAEGAQAGGPSPLQATWQGNPGSLAAVRDGRAGVQDAGSQLVALALARAEAPIGTWLDLCAGPGGKAALLAALAAEQDQHLVANERSMHRADLVSSTVRAVRPEPLVVCGDGTRPPWRDGSFVRVLADVPCTGLGALRRRPESRWRHQPEDLDDLGPLQRSLLTAAIDSCRVGGVVGYATCSPHRSETVEVVADVLAGRDDVALEPAGALVPEVDGADGDFLQLWPHRHGTDAMFLAIIRRTA